MMPRRVCLPNGDSNIVRKYVKKKKLNVFSASLIKPPVDGESISSGHSASGVVTKLDAIFLKKATTVLFSAS